MSLQMDRQENLLNDIFRLAAIQANAGAIAARCCPQDGRKRSEKLTISTSIAIDRRAHQRGPSLLELTTLHAIPHASLLAARTLLHEWESNDTPGSRNSDRSHLLAERRPL